jgi:hypothetical protein
VADHGHSYQWSLWAVTETEAHLFTLLANKVFLPKEQRSDKAVAAATEALKGARRRAGRQAVPARQRLHDRESLSK